MKLIDDWHTVLRKAWSARLWWLAAAVQVAAFIVDLASNGPFSFWVKVSLQVLAVGLSLAGLYARIVLQRKLHE
ncbi:hypothetical protein J2W32_004465 [Variovorax boronicumulans]|uniref:Uncharacterized protein n=1 Tax=Variovorax boronicumulans TaxID=436515 RepID=A0AAW8D2T6_9BURK|nr:hypothetical protein [Variovorax boronicumulans]MDP9895367.1 hypothetical protein [Variovorax boronicumulans]MDQ0055407.1 hypothetical protein [Variovorax boronicumulans]